MSADPAFWTDALARVLAREGRAVLVSIANAAGSTPRDSGARMIVGASVLEGSIGGGHLEFEATGIARKALRDRAPPAVWIVRFPLAARLGQCCGGVATLAFATIEVPAGGWLRTAQAHAQAAMPFAVVSALGEHRGASGRLIVTSSDAVGTLDEASLDDAAVAAARARLASDVRGAAVVNLAKGASLLIEIERPDPFPILVFGNGHVGRALVRVLSVLDARIRWIDERESDFPEAVPANTEIVVTDTPTDEIERAPFGAFVVVMTHSHALDFDLIEAALTREDWRYLGLIGSKAKRAQFEKRLAQRGYAAEALARVTCPIGMRTSGIRSKDPGAIAIAVAAELCARRESVVDSRPSRKSGPADATR
jgi:xanthine dehydrogenase accessory factor